MKSGLAHSRKRRLLAIAALIGYADRIAVVYVRDGQ